MPIRLVPMPVFPITCCLVKTIVLKTGTLLDGWMYSDHWFLPNGSSSTFNITTFCNDMLFQWAAWAFDYTLCATSPNMAFEVFTNVKGYVQHQRFSPSWPNHLATGQTIGPQFKVTCRRRAQVMGSYPTSYFHFPPVPQVYVTNDRLNSTGSAAYQACLNYYFTPIVSQGLTFKPAVSSNNRFNLDLVRILDTRPLIRFRRKSRIKEPSKTYYYSWPTVL